MNYKRLTVMLLVMGALVSVMLSSCTSTDTTISASEEVSEVSEFEIIRAAADAWVSSGKEPNITALELDRILERDIFILSVCDPDIYILGHVPGAINIYWKDVFKKENLELLPKDKQIIVYSNTGHTGSQVTALLNTLGYDAINLKWGMASWSTNEELTPERYEISKDCMGYLSMPGTEPGSRAETEECG
jgi:rhodanese-related sulfurtransferase